MVTIGERNSICHMFAYFHFLRASGCIVGAVFGCIWCMFRVLQASINVAGTVVCEALLGLPISLVILLCGERCDCVFWFASMSLCFEFHGLLVCEFRRRNNTIGTFSTSGFESKMTFVYMCQYLSGVITVLFSAI